MTQEQLSATIARIDQRVQDLHSELLGNGQPGRIQRLEGKLGDHIRGHNKFLMLLIGALIASLLSLGVALIDNRDEVHLKAKPSPSIAVTR